MPFEWQESHEKGMPVIIWKCKNYYVCQEKFKDKYIKDKKLQKVRDHYHYTSESRFPPHSTYNSKYIVSKRVILFFRNGSKYVS